MICYSFLDNTILLRPYASQKWRLAIAGTSILFLHRTRTSSLMAHCFPVQWKIDINRWKRQRPFHIKYSYGYAYYTLGDVGWPILFCLTMTPTRCQYWQRSRLKEAGRALTWDFIDFTCIQNHRPLLYESLHVLMYVLCMHSRASLMVFNSRNVNLNILWIIDTYTALENKLMVLNRTWRLTVNTKS